MRRPQPAIAVDITLTISNTANSDGSYTVTNASGTYGSLTVTGVAPVGTDGSDNKLFLNGKTFVDFGGITFVTNGTPGGAGSASSADVNFYYTSTSRQPNNVYAVDTATVSEATAGSLTVTPICFMTGTLNEALYPHGRTIPELPYVRAKAHRQVPTRIPACLRATEDMGAIVRAAS